MSSILGPFRQHQEGDESKTGLPVELGWYECRFARNGPECLVARWWSGTALFHSRRPFAGNECDVREYTDFVGPLKVAVPESALAKSRPEGDDDALPITEEWLRSVGGTSNHGVHWLFDFLIEQKSGWEIFLRIDASNEWDVSLMQSPVGNQESRGLVVPTADVATRGQLRKLCDALGIKLSERVG